MEKTKSNEEINIKEKIKEIIYLVGVLGALYLIVSILYFNYPGLKEVVNRPWLDNILIHGPSVGTTCIILAAVALNIKLIVRETIKLTRKGLAEGARLFIKLLKYVWNKLRHKTTEKKSIGEERNDSKVDNKPEIIQSGQQEETEKKVVPQQDYSMILQCFQKYKLDFVKVKGHQEGPTITRYILELGDGLIRQLAQVEKELAITLGVEGVAINPSAKGVIFDVPNKTIRKVPFYDISKEYEERKSTHMLEIPVGQTAIGELLTLNIAECPHILIAGATNSGKSVCINTIICGLLVKATPEEVRLILVDPKKVELSDYEGVPHLLMPVIKDINKAVGALAYAVKEMDERYEKMSQVGARNIISYNKKVSESENLPYIVIVIDEVADLLIQVKDQVVDAIQRLGQLARAAGIHLILGTQRPSVDILDGVIKANISGRIAFAVSSNIDSRVILDQAGAEKLLGKGDGLLLTPDRSKPDRFQGAYISDEEIEEVVRWAKDSFRDAKKVEVEAIDGEEANEEIMKCDSEGENEKLTRLRKYIAELVIANDQEEPIHLPVLNKIREELNIRKADLIVMISQLEKEKILIKQGKNRWMRVQINMSQKQAITYMKSIVPRMSKGVYSCRNPL